MTRQTKLSLSLAGAFLLVVAALLGLTAMSEPETAPVGAGESQLVREDSHVLGAEGGSGVTFVEFLDFECEACLAAYPAVEQLRADYEGEVTFVVRYFPLDGHFNAERAARAVEAASRQGAFEEMYQRMYDTPEEWSHQQVPTDDVFVGFAEDLGLDVERFRADYDDPAVAARVEADRRDGVALGVQGTPTFFVDGERIEPRTYDDFTEALDDALAG